MHKLVKHNLVHGLPNSLSKCDHSHCISCNKGKQIKSSFKSKNVVSTKRPLELLHIDLFGPVRTASLSGKHYGLVVVDDYSRYAWVLFLAHKSQALESFEVLVKQVENLQGYTVKCVRSDHGGEFESEPFYQFCEDKGIVHNFSAPRTPQQNGVVERKNRTLQEMARTMLCESSLPKSLWAEAVSTACYVQNRVLIHPQLAKTPYELWRGRKPNISYFHPFGAPCTILNTKDNLDKFDPKVLSGNFIGYSTTSKAYRVYLPEFKIVEESINVKFDERVQLSRGSDPEEDVSKNMELEINSRNNTLSNVENAGIDSSETDKPFTHPPVDSWKFNTSHPKELIIGEPTSGVTTRNRNKQLLANYGFVSSIEPTKVQEALSDEAWVVAMQEELNQFVRNQVWELVPKPQGKSIIGTRWVFRNKLDENGNITRNKARLVAQGYNQQEGIDFNETFAPVARIEAIRILLAFAVQNDITLHQMDVKSAFLNGVIQEEVYVKQPPGFEDPNFPNHVYRLKRALYGLKQAPRAWYDRLSSFLIENGFVRGQVDKTLFRMNSKNGRDFMIVQVYVDDIIFGATRHSLCKKFENLMKAEFEMSGQGPLKFFLGLQIVQEEGRTFIHQQKYIKELLKKYDLEKAKPMSTPMCASSILHKDELGEKFDQTKYRGMIGSLLYLTASRPDIMYSVCLCARFQADPRDSHHIAVKRILRYLLGTLNLCLMFEKGSSFRLTGFSDADYAGDRIERKSTSGGCHFLGENMVSWVSRRQQTIALSTTEAEYMAAASCCSQLLWIKYQLEDYSIKEDSIPIYCDSTSAINLSKNPIQHSKAKHIEVRHHFIRDYVERNIVRLEFVDTNSQLADIFTKPLARERFEELRRNLNMVRLDDVDPSEGNISSTVSV